MKLQLSENEKRDKADYLETELSDCSESMLRGDFDHATAILARLTVDGYRCERILLLSATIKALILHTGGETEAALSSLQSFEREFQNLSPIGVRWVSFFQSRFLVLLGRAAEAARVRQEAELKIVSTLGKRQPKANWEDLELRLGGMVGAMTIGAVRVAVEGIKDTPNSKTT